MPAPMPAVPPKAIAPATVMIVLLSAAVTLRLLLPGPPIVDVLR